MNAPGDTEQRPTFDPRTGTYHVTVDWRRTDPVSRRLVSAVATVLEVEETDLEPLTECVDPDALDALFRPRPRAGSRDGGVVQFRFNGRDVVVDGRGHILIRRPGAEYGDPPRFR